VTLGGVKLCTETTKVLGARGGGVALTSLTLALAFFMIETVGGS